MNDNSHKEVKRGMKQRASKYRKDGQVANRIKQSFKGSRISDLEDEKGDFMNLKEYQ